MLSIAVSATLSLAGANRAAANGEGGDTTLYSDLKARVSLTDPVALYNLGTVSLRLAKPGEAVAYLERANRISPFDPEIQTNLLIARKELAKLLGGESTLDPSSSSIEGLADRVTLEQVRGAIGLASLLLGFFWLRAYRQTRSIQRSWSAPAGLFAGIGLTLSLGLYAAILHASASPPAAALQRTPVRSGPSDSFLSLSALDAGVIVRLTGEVAPPWSQIRFGGDQIGWVKTQDLLMLSPAAQ